MNDLFQLLGNYTDKVRSHIKDNGAAYRIVITTRDIQFQAQGFSGNWTTVLWTDNMDFVIKHMQDFLDSFQEK